MLYVDRKNEEFVLHVDKEFLKDSPGFDKDNWPGTADSYFSNVTTYYDTN